MYMTAWRYEISLQVLKYFSTRGISHLHTAMSYPVFINFIFYCLQALPDTQQTIVVLVAHSPHKQ